MDEACVDGLYDVLSKLAYESHRTMRNRRGPFWKKPSGGSDAESALTQAT